MVYLICIFATCFERLACLDSISVMIGQQAASSLFVEGSRNLVSHIIPILLFPYLVSHMISVLSSALLFRSSKLDILKLFFHVNPYLHLWKILRLDLYIAKFLYTS